MGMRFPRWSTRCTNATVSGEFLAARCDRSSLRLLRSLSAASSIEHVLMALVGMVKTADKREERVTLVCLLVAKMTLAGGAPFDGGGRGRCRRHLGRFCGLGS